MIRLGLERCLQQPPDVLRGRRFGLLMNQASVDGTFRYACDLLDERLPGQLKAIFSPQHGIWGEQQANMIESPHGFHQRLELPIYSLYSETRQPAPEMLEGIECLVVDLQDVGTRVYTFIWTVSHCLEACAAAQIPLLVLDRPNPLGGLQFEGPLLDTAFSSFVGRTAIAMRHGCTIGELCRIVNDQLGIGASVEIVPMEGWQRAMLFPQTGRHWIAPSPNMPRYETALVYPGQVLLEGTNLSEGRGTTRPFELVGAPFVDPEKLVSALAGYRLPGVALLPLYFLPTFDKWKGQRCGGVSLHVVDAESFQPYRTTVAILASCRWLWPEGFQWLPPPYEYETEKIPIDILSGGPALREAIDGDAIHSADDLTALTRTDSSWLELAQRYWLYA